MKGFFNNIDGDDNDDSNGEPPSKNESSPESMERIRGLIALESGLIEKKVRETTDDRMLILIGQFPAALVAGLAAIAFSIVFAEAQLNGRGFPTIGWVFTAALVAAVVCGITSRLLDRTEDMREQMSRELMVKNGADPRLQFARTIIAAHSAWVTLKKHYQSVYAAVNGDMGAEGDKIADACFVLLGDGSKSISRAIAIFLLKEDCGLFGENGGAHDEVGFGTHEAELTAFIDATRTSDFGRQLINAAVKAQV